MSSIIHLSNYRIKYDPQFPSEGLGNISWNETDILGNRTGLCGDAPITKENWTNSFEKIVLEDRAKKVPKRAHYRSITHS